MSRDWEVGVGPENGMTCQVYPIILFTVQVIISHVMLAGLLPLVCNTNMLFFHQINIQIQIIKTIIIDIVKGASVLSLMCITLNQAVVLFFGDMKAIQRWVYLATIMIKLMICSDMMIMVTC